MKRLKENRKLPARWVLKHGAYYYLPTDSTKHLWDGKSWFRLGSSLPEAYRTWAARVELTSKIVTFNQLFDKYLIEVIPQKAPKTQVENFRQLETIRAVFGNMLIKDLEPQHVYQYHEKRKAKVAGKREIEVLSHTLTKAVQWGLIKSHPFKGEVRISNNKPRTRYVTDQEIKAALSLPSSRKKGSVRMVQAYLKLKLMTGLRQRDLLLLTCENFTDDGLLISPSKTAKTTGKRTLYEWHDDLRNVYAECLEVRPAQSEFIFCKRDGKSYVRENGTAPAWGHLWDGFIIKLLESGQISERFTEHDLRAKVASDADNLDHARALLGHADSSITNRVYRRKTELVKPLHSKH